jgi:hypothetical protein
MINKNMLNKNCFESNLNFAKKTVTLNQLDVNNCLFTSELLAILLRSYKNKYTYNIHSSNNHRKMIKDK